MPGYLPGIGRIDGRPVAFSASDLTVKAGEWGEKSVQKNLRIQEVAMQMRIPMFYLIHSAGARITDQVRLFPGRNQGGRTFYNQIKMSGVVPQIALMFGPLPAGAAYTPAFADIAIMVEGNASAYLGSPRMAEMVTREKVTLDQQLGGARMHCTVSGLGDYLAESEQDASNDDGEMTNTSARHRSAERPGQTSRGVARSPRQPAPSA